MRSAVAATAQTSMAPQGVKVQLKKEYTVSHNLAYTHKTHTRHTHTLTQAHTHTHTHTYTQAHTHTQTKTCT